jgi:hypothetical protein
MIHQKNETTKRKSIRNKQHDKMAWLTNLDQNSEFRKVHYSGTSSTWCDITFAESLQLQLCRRPVNHRTLNFELFSRVYYEIYTYYQTITFCFCVCVFIGLYWSLCLSLGDSISPTDSLSVFISSPLKLSESLSLSLSLSLRLKKHTPTHTLSTY